MPILSSNPTVPPYKNGISALPSTRKGCYVHLKLKGDQGDSLDVGRSSHLYHLLKKGNKVSRDNRYEEVVICPLQQHEPLYYTSIDTSSVKRTHEQKSKYEAYDTCDSVSSGLKRRKIDAVKKEACIEFSVTEKKENRAICTEGEEPCYAGVPMSIIVEKGIGIGDVISLLWFERSLIAREKAKEDSRLQAFMKKRMKVLQKELPIFD
nr:ATP-citrate synthase beta chain protein 1-like [Tanacetum cinerariifolium]